MKDGDRLTLLGTVSAARAGTTKTGSAYVKGTLATDDGGSWKIVWWDATSAAAAGQRVQLNGKVRSYNGSFELAVDETHVQRPLPDDPRARLVGYLLECTEAEGAAELSSPVNSSAHLVLPTPVCPLFTDQRTTLPTDPATARWVKQRLSSIGETLLVGYPLIVGDEQGNNGTRRVVRPLFVGEANIELNPQDQAYSVGRVADSLDPNPHALELLGMTRDERDEFIAALDGSAAFEEARGAEQKLRIGLDLLREVSPATAAEFNSVEPRALTGLSDQAGVHNAAALFATIGSSQITRSLVGELEALLKQPSALSAGPLGRLLGEQGPMTICLPTCHPIVVPSTLRQDQAVHSALTETFTVVTGPPGTGKSQVLVNVVAAAVAAGQTVLFASKNNKAVDVVFERMRSISPNSNVLRAGAASRRQELAAAIGSGLDRVGVAGNINPQRARQAAVARSVDPVLGKVKERLELEAAARSMQSRLGGLLQTLPSTVDLDVDLYTYNLLLSNAEVALKSFEEPLPFLKRGKRRQLHAERTEQAGKALGALHAFMAQVRLPVLSSSEVLAPVSAKPRRSSEPRARLLPVVEQLQLLTEAVRLRTEVDDLWVRIERDYAKWRIDDELAALTQERLDAGRALLNGTWDALLTDHPSAVAAARLVHSSLQASASGGAGAAQAKQNLPRMLAAFPAWGVTNLSAGTNYPLQPAMFDLVVIDEASQCDLASAIPLLYRAKRALIIGDQKQLTHITQLGRVRSDNLANRWMLTDEQRVDFDFRTRSLFAVAAGRVGSPLLLDMHFRSQAAIITFSNRRFYGQQLEVCTTSTRKADNDEPTVSWLDVPGDSERGRGGRSWRNVREARAVAQEIARVLPILQGTGQSIGVVTPFRAQAEEIRDEMNRLIGAAEAASVAVDTAHRFQGDERDVILFSPVLGPSMTKTAVSFANDPNLVNVALTRARHRLRVVGNRAACLSHRSTVIGEFAEYVSRLEAGPFDSPLELQLYEALITRGLHTVAGYQVGSYRLDLAVDPDGAKLDIECDGKAFHLDTSTDSTRDRALAAQGWHVLRFSGRELSRGTERCADQVLEKLKALSG